MYQAYHSFKVDVPCINFERISFCFVHFWYWRVAETLNTEDKCSRIGMCIQVSEIECQHTIVATAQMLPEIAVDVLLLYKYVYIYLYIYISIYIINACCWKAFLLYKLHASLNRCKSLTKSANGITFLCK